VEKQFFPEEGTIQVHQLRACSCLQLPIGFYWYGGNRYSTISVPRWVEKLLQSDVSKDMGELTQSGTTQCEDKAVKASDSDGQPPDNVITDDQETDVNKMISSQQSRRVLASLLLMKEDDNQYLSKTPRYNLKDPSIRRPLAKYK